jgi:arabinofuranosyltransferase
VLIVALSIIFFKNAWVDEDAYITFRSIEQLFAGNGPRWNPHERVQAFTHPLWLFVLSLFRIFTRDLFIAAILASYLCCLAAAFASARLLRLGASSESETRQRWVLLGLLLVSSKSFFDFTSSGLETPLAYALLTLQLFVCLRTMTGREPPSARAVFATSLGLGLLLLTRHDLLLLVGPLQIALLWRCRSLGARAVLSASLAGLLPFVVWTLFSLVYYGFPFPNTAYAKLGTGIPSGTLWLQGLRYLQSLAADDPLGLLLIAAAATLCFARRSPGSIAIGTGLVLHTLYVTKVGGDYMTGRFFAAPYLLAALFLVQHYGAPARSLSVVAMGGLLYAWLLPGAPLLSGASFQSERPNEFGVGDQRGLLSPMSSLHRWLDRDPAEPFPDYAWSREGRAFASAPERVMVRANMGFMGYHAGTRKIIIDRLGLADPLLARLPSQAIWRIGHFPRRVPAGYVESVESGESRILDPGLRAYHEKLRLITQGEIFDIERLEVILLMNFGYYDRLLERRS